MTERDEVDALYTQALDEGAEGLRAPYDAFFGSRFAVVMAPGPVAVGIKSDRDADQASAPPAISEFA